MTASVSDVLVVVCFFCYYKICVLSKSRTKYGGEFGYSQFFRRIFAGQKNRQRIRLSAAAWVSIYGTIFLSRHAVFFIHELEMTIDHLNNWPTNHVNREPVHRTFLKRTFKKFSTSFEYLCDLFTNPSPWPTMIFPASRLFISAADDINSLRENPPFGRSSRTAQTDGQAILIVDRCRKAPLEILWRTKHIYWIS